MLRRVALLGLGRSSFLQLGRNNGMVKEPGAIFNLKANSDVWNGSGTFRRWLSVSGVRRDLMEFFEEEKNWGESTVRAGRSWKIDELRIKSNTDLHKLWYILLKEKNMLLTMEEECKRACELFPNPERIDKVEESMQRLEEVVRERNRSYFLLETGETGERPGAEYENFLGLPEYRQHEEYAIPMEQNKPFLKAKSEEPVVEDSEKKWFLTRWREKQRRKQKRVLRGQQYQVIKILQHFPDTDPEALKEKFPDVDIDKYIYRFTKDRVPGNLKAKNYFEYGIGYK